MSRTEAEGPPEPAEAAALAVPVWDLPVRLVHWLLVVLIGLSWWSAENGELDWHFRSGMAVLFLILFRLLWGVMGSSTARFAGFVRGPAAVSDYLRRAKEWSGIGHTPLGALSVVALLGLIAAQVGLGLFLSDEDGVVSAPLNRFVSFDTAEAARELHELLFNVLLGLIALHVAAILYYRVARGKNLVGPMLSGRARLAAGTQGMVAAPAGRLALALAIAAALTWWIWSGLPPLGT